MWNFEIDDERQAIEACASMPETTFRAMRGAFDGTALRAFRDVPNRRAYEAVIVAHIAADYSPDDGRDCRAIVVLRANGDHVAHWPITITEACS